MRTNRRLRLLAGAVGLGVAVGGAAGAVQWWQGAVSRAGPLAEAKAVVVPHGGTTQLAQALAAAGVIDQPMLFRADAWLTQGAGTLHAAEFRFPVAASVRQVLAVLRGARPVEHHVTIAEGLTAQQIVTLLQHAEDMSGEVRTITEGSVLPQTYDYEYGAERSVLVGRATAAMDKALAAAWADRAPGLGLSGSGLSGSGLSGPRDALILASIVERETARPEERAHVAAVYLNRLRQGMKLQADPTVVYSVSNGAGVLDHRLTRAELGRDDAFNTYRSAGLPPAPICSPSLDSIKAVLHPMASEDLFFVADGTGGHVFSRSYEAHDSAVARWRTLAPRGGAE